MRPEELTAKWEAEAKSMSQRGALVNGAFLVDEFLKDFAAVIRNLDNEQLTLAQAASESGYSADYLGLLVRQPIADGVADVFQAVFGADCVHHQETWVRLRILRARPIDAIATNTNRGSDRTTRLR